MLRREMVAVAVGEQTGLDRGEAPGLNSLSTAAKLVLVLPAMPVSTKTFAPGLPVSTTDIDKTLNAQLGDAGGLDFQWT